MTALTPDDLARIEERAVNIDNWKRSAASFYAEDVPALVAGVRSLQARITELETVIAEAPHARECMNLTPAHYFAKPACTCWKSRYRAGADQ